MVLSIIFLVASAGQSAQPGPSAYLVSLLDSYADKGFNGFLYAGRDGKQVFFHAVGYASREQRKAFTFDTGIEIGSIVKPISQIALIKLCAAGKLSLDDPISKFFANVPADKKGITVRLLAGHRAGFQDVFGDDYEPMKKDELIRKMLDSKLEFEPGTKNQYSNSGYSMLAAIIEKVSGKSFEQTVSKLELTPIGLRRTGYVLPRWKSSQVACGYDADGKKWGTPMDHFWFKDGPGWNLRGNGGMITTIPELARWARAAHDGELMDATSYKFFAPGLASLQASGTLKPGAVWSVAGGNGIFDTVVGYNPSRHLVVVAFSSDARFQIEDVLMKDIVKPLFSLADSRS